MSYDPEKGENMAFLRKNLHKKLGVALPCPGPPGWDFNNNGCNRDNMQLEIIKVTFKDTLSDVKNQLIENSSKIRFCLILSDTLKLERPENI